MVHRLGSVNVWCGARGGVLFHHIVESMSRTSWTLPLGGVHMDLARYVVDAVVVEGRGVREVARAHGVSKSWVSALVIRYRTSGYEALAPRSKRRRSSPGRDSPMSAGRPTSPNGPWPTAGTWRSSTSSTTTPGRSPPPRCGRSPRPPRCSPPSTIRLPPGGSALRCSRTTRPSSTPDLAEGGPSSRSNWSGWGSSTNTPAPQTCGKIERWHQTLKKFLIK